MVIPAYASYDSQGHPKATDPAEKGPHINYWDYTKGSRSSGKGEKGAVPIKERGEIDPGLLPSLLIPWPLLPSELGCAELNCDDNGIPDHEEKADEGCAN